MRFGQVGSRGFGVLVVRHIVDMSFADIDDSLAKTENLKVNLPNLVNDATAIGAT